MRRLRLGAGALAGTLVTAPLIAVMALAYRLAHLPFSPFDLFDWVTRVLPGKVVTFGIDSMIWTLEKVGLDVADVAKTAERSVAVIQFFVLGVVVATVFFAALSARRARAGTVAGLVVGALFGAPMAILAVTIGQSPVSPAGSVPWLAGLFLAWGLTLAWTFRRTVPAAAEAPSEARSLDRRRFLVRLGAASAVVTVAGAGVAELLALSEGGGASRGGARATVNGKGEPFPNAGDPVVPAPGTRPELTPLDDFYSVFIRTEPTVIDGDSWELPVTGLVAKPLRLKLDDFYHRYPSRDQYATLSCISGRIGTGLISTTLWTGVPIQTVLDEAGVQPGAKYLHVRSGDGYYETVDLDLVAADPRIMLCHSWDGKPLPVGHGFPLRIWIPDRYGMKQPKWITAIEVSAEYVPGYWVKRGWDRVARVQETSVVDTVAVKSAFRRGGRMLVPVGGIAFSGAKGISKVEVKVDDGPWAEAKLRKPLSDTTWVVWRYDWPLEAGRHTFTVRCYDGSGTPQVARPHAQRPAGATGLDHETANVKV